MSYAPIENEGAYYNAIQRRIAANAAKSRVRKMGDWLAADPSRAALIEQIHDAAFYGRNGPNFFAKLSESIGDWGPLSEGQEAAARRILVQRAAEKAEKQAGRAAQIAADVAGSKHVGAVGERKVFDLVLEKRLSFEGDYGMSYRHLMRDPAGNVFVHKGSYLNVGEGQRFRVKASIKAHDVYQGIAQNVIARPAIQAAIADEVAEIKL